MAVTSGLTAFNLDLNELVEDAFERCGSSCARATTCARLVGP